MKRLPAFFLAAFFAATAAHAGQLVSDRPLMEKLKERGLLTEDDIKAIEKDKTGFIDLGGRLHVQYRSEGKDTGPATAHAANQTGFLVKRMTLEVKAQLTDAGYMVIEPEFAGSTGWNKLNDAFIAFPAVGPVNVYVGQKKVPFSWEELTSSKNLSFIDSGYASQVGVGRQLGAEVEYFGAEKTFAVNAGLYNGNVDTGSFGALQMKKQRLYSNSNVSGNDNGGGNMLAARLELHPFGYLAKGYENFSGETKTAFGVSYYTSDDKSVASASNTGTATDTWITGSNALGLDAIYRSGGFEVSGEYANRTFKYAGGATLASSTEQSVSQTALQIGASYLLNDKTALAVRYDNFDNGAAQGFAGGPVKAKTDAAITVGASYYLKKHNLKLQANYVMKDESYDPAALGTKEKASNDVFVIQAAYSF